MVQLKGWFFSLSSTHYSLLSSVVVWYCDGWGGGGAGGAGGGGAGGAGC